MIGTHFLNLFQKFAIVNYTMVPTRGALLSTSVITVCQSMSGKRCSMAAGLNFKPSLLRLVDFCSKHIRRLTLILLKALYCLSSKSPRVHVSDAGQLDNYGFLMHGASCYLRLCSWFDEDSFPCKQQYRSDDVVMTIIRYWTEDLAGHRLHTLHICSGVCEHTPCKRDFVDLQRC